MYRKFTAYNTNTTPYVKSVSPMYTLFTHVIGSGNNRKIYLTTIEERMYHHPRNLYMNLSTKRSIDTKEY